MRIKKRKKGQRLLWNSIREFPSGMGCLGSTERVSFFQEQQEAGQGGPEPFIREEMLSKYGLGNCCMSLEASYACLPAAK